MSSRNVFYVTDGCLIYRMGQSKSSALNQWQEGFSNMNIEPNLPVSLAKTPLKPPINSDEAWSRRTILMDQMKGHNKGNPQNAI